MITQTDREQVFLSTKKQFQPHALWSVNFSKPIIFLIYLNEKDTDKFLLPV